MVIGKEYFRWQQKLMDTKLMKSISNNRMTVDGFIILPFQINDTSGIFFFSRLIISYIRWEDKTDGEGTEAAGRGSFAPMLPWSMQAVWRVCRPMAAVNDG